MKMHITDQQETIKMSNDKQIQARESQVMGAFELQGIKNQLAGLLDDNPKKLEAFKTKILKMSLSYMLKDCPPESIIKCGIQALTLNLSLEGGQGYIVKYGGVASFDCGYKGWQVLARRAGYMVDADVVYSCDKFEQDGFGFDRKFIFEPDFSQRQGSNDQWAKQNLTGVIVSVMEEKSGIVRMKFVPADMIMKIVGKSPSVQSEKGKAHSPHEHWAEQMFLAKAIKQVLTKESIDLSESSQLNAAFEIVNNTEQLAQTKTKEEYSQERFDQNYPKWIELVQSAQKKPMAIITHLSNSFALTVDQMESLYKLNDHAPIEGEIQFEDNQNA